MARNLNAIRKWCRDNRPDLVDGLNQVVEAGNDGIILLMTTAFEAGRMFQANEVENSSHYVPMEELY